MPSRAVASPASPAAAPAPAAWRADTRPRARSALRLGGLSLAGAAACFALWSLWLEPASLRNDTTMLALSGWPATCDGLRVAVLADLHVGSPFNDLAKLAEVVRLTSQASPDLVLLAGDYVIGGVPGGHFTPPEPIAAELARLTAPLGVWAVLGNHDGWYDAARVTRALEGAGIRVLQNASTPLADGACRFWLAGLGDLWTGSPDLEASLCAVPAGAASIAFTHNPDLFPQIPPRVTLTIAGHTHGGQVALPGIGRPVVPSAYGERFAIGHVVEGGRHLFVSSGLGTSIFPIRFRVPPEVSVVVLRSEAEAPASR